MMDIRTLNPSTGALLEVFEPHSAEHVEEILSLASNTQQHWRTRLLNERTAPLKSLAILLRDKAGLLADLMTLEMGKPLPESRAEILKCARFCEHCAENAHKHLTPEPIDIPGQQSWVRFDPIGAILGIMPWNFPFWQVIRFAVPTLAAGNVALLKHAESVPRCALALEELFLRAGFPAGCFQTLMIDYTRIAPLIEDARIAAVALTGSERAGMSVAETAGRALKPTVLELGGSDSFIVLKDANIDLAVRLATASRLLNAGQSCIAAKRFIVERAVADTFILRFKDALSAQVVGDPREELTTVGPMARENLRAQLHEQVLRTVEAGAELVLGGVLPEGPGFFYPVTLLTEVPHDSAAALEEIFGPVAAVFVVEDADEALALANQSRYGLGAAVITSDTSKGMQLAARLEVGNVAINDFVRSDPRMPFGGIKMSGYGRELAREGFRAFVNVKSVWVRGESS